jgi:hypothetical protein
VIALLALAVTGAPAQAAPDAGACVAEHARVAEAEGAEAAQAAFARCARKAYGAAVEPRIERCTADLFTLPVVLLYRSDGLDKSAALADMKRDEQTDATTPEGRRTLLMLDFAYQGSGPASRTSDAWMNQRTAQWTDRCLRGTVPN